MKFSSLLSLTLLSLSFLPRSAHANGFGGMAGIALDLGQAGNNSLSIPQRTMNGFSIEAMPGYQFNKWTVGVDLDYTIQGQNTPIANVNNTNWQGNSILAGLGGMYQYSPAFYGLVAIDFLGKYTFKATGGTSIQSYLEKPITVRFKVGWVPFTSLPDWTLDLDIRYFTYHSYVANGIATSTTSTEAMAGLGITYHFGGGGSSSRSSSRYARGSTSSYGSSSGSFSSASSGSDAAASGKPGQFKTTRSSEGVLIVMSSGGFKIGTANLTDSSVSFLKGAARALQKRPSQKVEINAYGDPGDASDKTQAWADAVKAELVNGGVSEDRITANGLGPTNPVGEAADNRRVEIKLPSGK